MVTKLVTRCRALLPRAIWVGSILLAGLVASLSMWDPLEIDEEAHLKRITVNLARTVRTELSVEMHSRILARARLANFLAAREPLSKQDWDLSRVFLTQYPDDVVTEWVDPFYRVTKAAGRDEHDEAFDVTTEPTMKLVLAAARDRPSRDAVISPAFQLPDGRTVGAVVVPVFAGDVFGGFVITVFDIKATLDSMLADDHEMGYAVAVSEGPREIYRRSGTTREFEDAWAQSVELEFPGTTWRVRVWPNADMLNDMLTPLPELALVLGALLGLTLMATVHFARAAHLRSNELRQGRDELERRVSERTIELEHSNRNLEAQIVERERAEDSLRRLSGCLLRLQDEERRRIARELHDSTAQMLSAVAINVDRAQHLARAKQDAALAGLLADSTEFLERVMLEIRTISYLLHPPMLDDLGLEYVIPWYVEGFGKRSGIAVTLDVQPDLGRLPHEIEVTLFRITQEALSNIHRHSGSRTARIALFRDGESATTEIRDQGGGFPPGVLDVTTAISANLGVGIVGMRERVHQLGGKFTITSGRHGTTILTVLPLVTEAVAGIPSVIAEVC